MTFPTHRTLICEVTDKVTAVMDCFGGKVLRVSSVRYAIGQTMRTGPITNKGRISIDQKFWIVIGYSTWQAANAMKRKSKSAHRQLASGIWHEVISE